MIESFVDLTYRGLSLGRRIKLTQVRPSSGYLELPSPMPVGTQVAIATDDGVQFEATVVWVHEQVGSADKAPGAAVGVVPGMTVVPQLGAPAAAAWWTSRVVLLDEPGPRLRPTRSRPVTLRPRSHTHPTPPPPTASAGDTPAIIADLDARVAAAAGVAPLAPAVALDQRTAVMSAVDQSQLEQLSRQPDGDGQTAEHDVVDDGSETMIMASVDTAALGLDSGPSDAAAELRDDDAATRSDTGERD